MKIVSFGQHGEFKLDESALFFGFELPGDAINELDAVLSSLPVGAAQVDGYCNNVFCGNQFCGNSWCTHINLTCTS